MKFLGSLLFHMGMGLLSQNISGRIEASPNLLSQVSVRFDYLGQV